MRPRRLPRMLAGPLGSVVEYSGLDAWVVMNLKCRIEVVVPLLRFLRVTGNCTPKNAEGQTEEAMGALLILVVMPDAVRVVEMEPLPSGAGTQADTALLLKLR